MSPSDETEHGVDDLPCPEDFPEPPQSLSLSVVASNAIQAVREAAYAEGFEAGRLAGLDQAIGVLNRPRKSLKDNGILPNPPF